MSDGSKEKALGKIRKLLKMGEDGRGNVNEAEAALRQARALMDKHQINELEAREFTMSPEYGSASVTTGTYHVFSDNSTNSKWERILVRAVAMLFKAVEQVESQVDPESDRVHWKVTFYGNEAEVMAAAWTFDYLRDIVAKDCDSFFLAVKEAVGRTTNVEPMIQYLRKDKKAVGPDMIEALSVAIDVHIQVALNGGDDSEVRRHFKEAMAGAIQLKVKDLLTEREESLRKSGSGQELMVLEKSMTEKILKDHPELNVPYGSAKLDINTAATMVGAYSGGFVDLNVNPLQGAPKHQHLNNNTTKD